MVGAARQEYFMAGSAPNASCAVNPAYTYNDSLNYYGYAPDTLSAESGWWARMKARLLRGDSLTTPAYPTAELTTTYPDTLARDTVARQPALPGERRGAPRANLDSLRAPPKLLGTPVKPDSTKPKPDTTRKTPPDTLGVHN